MQPVEFYVPTLGERSDLADNEVPIQALRLSQNVFRSEKGRLEIRPGYKILTSGTNPGGRIMGLGYFRTTGGTDKYLAGNQTGVWQYDRTNWVDITGIGSGEALTGSDTDHVRFTIMETGGVYTAIITNGVNDAKSWDGAAATYSDLGGGPGALIDSVVCANRLIGLRAPNLIKVSDFNNPAIWPSGAGFNANLIDAGDHMVGMESLNRTAFGVFGEESQWVGRAQSGSHPIRFERIAEESGPMSSASLVNLGSAVYYLGDDYNIYRFDGVSCQAIGWAMKPWVEANVDVGHKRMAHGTYFDKIGKLFWFFPGKGQTGPNLGIHLDPKTGEMGRLSYGRYITASNRVRIVVTVTWADLAGFTWDDIVLTYPTWESFGDSGAERRVAFGATDGNVYVSGVGDGSDSNSPIEALFEVPLKTYAGWPRSVIPETFETFFQQTTNPTTVELSLGHTDTLMGALDYSFVKSFDLSKVQRNDIDLSGAVKEKRFVTIRQRVNAQTGQVAWNGGLFRFDEQDIAAGPTSDA